MWHRHSCLCPAAQPRVRRDSSTPDFNLDTTLLDHRKLARTNRNPLARNFGASSVSTCIVVGCM